MDDGVETALLNYADQFQDGSAKHSSNEPAVEPSGRQNCRPRTCWMIIRLDNITWMTNVTDEGACRSGIILMLTDDKSVTGRWYSEFKMVDDGITAEVL